MIQSIVTIYIVTVTIELLLLLTLMLLRSYLYEEIAR